MYADAFVLVPDRASLVACHCLPVLFACIVKFTIVLMNVMPVQQRAQQHERMHRICGCLWCVMSTRMSAPVSPMCLHPITHPATVICEQLLVVIYGLKFSELLVTVTCFEQSMTRQAWYST